MFLSNWCHIGGFYCQPNERLEAFVADSQHPRIAVLVILLVIILGLILFKSIITAISLLFSHTYRLTEESMRWLEMQGKHDRVIDVLKRIAGVNKKSLPVLHPDAQIEVILKFNCY